MSPSNASSDSARSDARMMSLDLERNIYREQSKTSKLLTRLRTLPRPFRKGNAIADLIKCFACSVTIVCLFQFFWIEHLYAGSTRVANDPFDNNFGQHIDRHSPLIWDDERQKFIYNAMPVPVHSHNDYERRIPLFEALGSGCISIEADVHLYNADLLVGHTSVDVHNNSTLRAMYLEPLERMLKTQNARAIDGTWRGIFDKAPQQTVVLLIDHKTSGPETFAKLHAQLQPLRDLDYLTFWNGTDRILRPITIVASGNAPFASVLALNSTRRDIFWDAKLEQLISAEDNFDADSPVYGHNRSNSYYASTKFQNARLYPFDNESHPVPLTPAVQDAMASQLDQAKVRGLITRYWATPANPPNLREIVWRVLVNLNVGVLNMDDMGVVRSRAMGWGKIES